MAAHARLFAASGYPVTVIAGRGPAPESNPPGINTLIEPLIDSKSERLNALNRELEQGQTPADFADFAEEIYQRLLVLLEGHTACFVHNALTLHKNLPLTAALVRIAQTQPLKIISWCHDLAWTNQLYLPVLYETYPWNLLKQAEPNITYVAISPQRQREILATFEPKLIPEQVPIIPNGVSVEEFLNIRPETAAIIEACGLSRARSEGALLLLLPARITRRKNIELGLKVIAALKKIGTKACLIVTGPPGPHNVRSDEYVRELFNLREELKVESDIIFLMERWQDESGKPRTLDDSIIFDLYRYCDALFFPSSQEGFGIPMLEAGLARLPVFCSNIPPFLELGEQNVTYFAPDADPALLAQIILTTLENDPAYRLRRSVLEKYTWDKIFEQKILLLLDVSY